MLELNKLYNMDCLAALQAMPDECINCCVTSPPYWGLRDYGVEGRFGLEKTPEEYVTKMVEIFREVRRVLRKDGTLWLNLGDSYVTSHAVGTKDDDTGWKHGAISRGYQARAGGVGNGRKQKDLVGIPWMLAFALRSDGWYLRQDIIWHKPNPMPESVKDRCTKAHEYIFLLSKSQRYYYDADAIAESMKQASIARAKESWNGNENRGHPSGRQNNMSKYMGSERAMSVTHRNKRSVWTVSTKPFKGAHFATFPPDLIEPCVLAGCPERGVVLDPFFGSGTTGLVAYQNGRNYIGIELNPEYVKMATERLEAVKAQTTLWEGIR